MKTFSLLLTIGAFISAIVFHNIISSKTGQIKSYPSPYGLTEPLESTTALQAEIDTLTYYRMGFFSMGILSLILTIKLISTEKKIKPSDELLDDNDLA